LIRLAVRDGNDALELESVVDAHRAAGGQLVSSTLLKVEIARVAVREELAGRDPSPIRMRLQHMNRFIPLDASVLSSASGFRQHIKTLDALHLATAAKVPGVRLLSSDATMRAVARANSIDIAGGEEHIADADYKRILHRWPENLCRSCLQCSTHSNQLCGNSGNYSPPESTPRAALIARS
jgi:predicted nucleic acid-binding protein